MREEIALSPKSIVAFLATAESGSVRHAAKELNMSQAAISRIIQRLEQQLDVNVFERMPTGMVLTAYGRALLPYAQALRREGRHAFEQVDALRGLRRGTVRIGSIASAASAYLPHVIREVIGRRPQFRYEILEATEDRLAEALMKLEIDLAIFGNQPSNSQLVEVKTRGMHDEYSLLAQVDHPIFDTDHNSFEALCQYDWVMPKHGTLPREEFEEVFLAADLDMPRIIVETPSVSAIKGLIAHGGFVGWLPLPLVAAEIEAGLVRPVPFAPLQLTRKFHCYRTPAKLMSPTATEFIQILSAYDFESRPVSLAGLGMRA